MEQAIQRGAQWIRESRGILVFSGAGMSTESGIPDFRSPGGIWDRYDPSDFAFRRILSDETVRERYWRMSSEFYASMRDAKPNRAHMAVRVLEDMGKLTAIVTQNVDRLHHKAGNSPDKIIEIHGTVFTVSCLTCGQSYDREEIETRLKHGVKVPVCDHCAGILKPDTISFGQAMPEEKMARSFRLAGVCDLCLVLGSSLSVYPAAAVPQQAAARGAGLMIVNRDPTPMDALANTVINGSVSLALDRMMQILGY